MTRVSKRTLAFVFAGLLAVLVILVGATMGIGQLNVPDDAVAFVDDVDDGEISQKELDVGIEQAAASEGAGEAPKAGTPQYNAAVVPAISDLLLARWVRGEAEERDIAVTEREIDVELETIIEQQFGGQEEFDKFLEQSNFSEEDALDRVELQLLTQCIQDQVIPQDPEAPAPATARQGCQGDEEVEITEDEIQKFYDDNIAQFETPETRDVRTLLNPDEEKAQEAADRLAEDPTPATWKDVTKELSTEEETADLGGLRPGVQEGQNDPALDEAIFSATEGEVVGPLEVEGTGFYVFEVEAINEAQTQPLDEATIDQIRQQLVTQEQQQAVTDFQDEFVAKWRARTVCSEDLLADDTDGTVESQLAERCSNFSVTDDGCLGDDESDELQPDPVTGEVPEEPTGCGAFVPSRPVIPAIPLAQEEEDPLLATPAGAATPLPQAPQPPPQDEGELPPGAEQLGLPGGVPPGTAPPGTVPPTGAPPTGAPPTGAPPTGAPPTTTPPGG
jgi:foldase protein PrsA